MSKRILVTGGAGFIGHHLIEHIFKNTDWEVACLDRLDISGNLHRLSELLDSHSEWKSRLKFVYHDLKAPIGEYIIYEIGKIDYIAHLAAASHVDRSIDYPLEFVMDNVVGTTNILNYARYLDGLELFINFGTDEQMGPAPKGVNFKEWDRYNATNPYAAAKCGAEQMCLAFANTYSLPLICTLCMNVVGERQHPEKYVPLCINKILKGEKITVHASPTGEPGKRHYIHARNVAAAVLFLVDKWTPREKYNIVGEVEINNLELARMIAKILDKPLRYDLVDFHSSRPGHDLRYSLDGTVMKNLGWKIPINFEEALAKTVQWTVNNPRWLK